MTTVDILIFLAFSPAVLGAVVVPFVVFFSVLAMDAREAYSARGVARRAPESTFTTLMSSALPTRPKANPVAIERPWERNVADALAAYEDERVFTVDTKGLCTVIHAAHRFARQPLPLRVIPETEGTDSVEGMCPEVFEAMVSREHEVWSQV